MLDRVRPLPALSRPSIVQNAAARRNGRFCDTAVGRLGSGPRSALGRPRPAAGSPERGACRAAAWPLGALLADFLHRSKWQIPSGVKCRAKTIMKNVDRVQSAIISVDLKVTEV